MVNSEMYRLLGFICNNRVHIGPNMSCLAGLEPKFVIYGIYRVLAGFLSLFSSSEALCVIICYERTNYSYVYSVDTWTVIFMAMLAAPVIL